MKVLALVLWVLVVGVAAAQTVQVYPSTVVRPTTTVAGLPACTASTQGAMYLVTNALLPAALATVGGGGSVVVGVTCNGTNFIVE